MPRSSRHKSHKQSKHTSKDYSDSDEDVKMKDKSSKDGNLVKVRDSLSGDKRKISSLLREGKEGKDQIANGNGNASGEYFSSKRRKEKGDAGIGGDRWNGGGEERSNNDRNAEKENVKGEGYKVDSKSKEFSSKGESSRISSKDKSKKYESGGVGEFREEILTPAILEKEDVKSKGESKRKAERDYSLRKDGKDFKEKDHRLEKEKEKEKDKDKSLGQESKRRDTEVKILDKDGGKKQGSQSGDHHEEKQTKHNRENPDCHVHDEMKIPESEKDNDKRLRRRRESSKDRGHRDDFKERKERGSFSSSVRSKDVNNKDEKHKDRYVEDGHKYDGQRDLAETKKDTKHKDDKYGEDGEKDARCRDDRYRGDSVRENRSKDEKHREGERDTKRKDDKYRDGVERDEHKDYRYHDDSGRDNRRRDDRFGEDGDKDGRHKNGRYYEDGDRDDISRENKYKEDGHRDNRNKEEKHREDNERGRRHKDSKQGNEFDGEKRMREAKYHEELATGDRSGDKFDPRHSIDDLYTTDHHSRKSSTFDVSSTHEDHTIRYRDDQGRKRTVDKEDFSDVRSRSIKDQRFDAENRIGSGSRMDSVRERGSSTSRNAELELNSSHRRRRSSPSSSSLALRDHYRLPKQDEFRYRDSSYEERLKHNITYSRDYTGTLGGSEKPLSSRSLEKLGQQEDGQLREISAEGRLISDIHSSPLKPLEKSPSSSADKRQFSRSNVRLSVDAEESAHRIDGARDVKDYSGKEFKESHELAMDRFPGDELSQVDADTLSVSSPFARNNHLSSSKSFPPVPPLRTVVDSSLISGLIEDDNRYKLNSRSRRGVDPNYGRNQGNAWRGVPSWPSPVANGFMPFPHTPPPVNFPSAMQPLPVPPLFGIRPSMELNRPTPFYISDADRFSGPVRPMGWHNPVDDSRPKLNAWDANNAVFRNESYIYGRPGWDNSRNMSGGPSWDTTEDMWMRPSKAANFEMPSFDEESNFTQNIDETLAGQFIQSSQKEQIAPDQPAVRSDNHLIYGTETNAPKALHTGLDTSDIAKSSKKDNVPLCHVYLSRLDISADLTELELFNQCSGFIGVGRSDVSDVDDSKILLIEEALEAKVASCQILSYSLSTPLDDTVFQRAMFLYKRQKDDICKVENTQRFFIADLPIPESDRGDLDIEEGKTVELTATSNVHGAKDGHMEFTSKSHTEDEHCTKFANQMADFTSASTMMSSEEPVSTLEHVSMQVDLASTRQPPDHNAEKKPLTSESIEGLNAHSDATAKMENDGNIEELMLVDFKCDTLLNSDVCSDAFEAMMPESVVSGSVNLSRIHHSPESTH